MKKITTNRGAATFTYIPIIIVMALILVIIGVFVVINMMKPEPRLKDITFNGIQIDQKVDEEMKNLVLDADFLYEYKDICIGVDESDKINDLRFYRTSTRNEDGEVEIIGIADMDIRCGDTKIESVDDVIILFGDGECECDEYFETITYEQDGYVLKLDVKNGEIFNISLKHTRK